MSADILLLLGLVLKAVVVNCFLRKTALVTHVGKIRDLKSKRLYQIIPPIIDVCHSLYDWICNRYSYSVTTSALLAKHISVHWRHCELSFTVHIDESRILSSAGNIFSWWATVGFWIRKILGCFGGFLHGFFRFLSNTERVRLLKTASFQILSHSVSVSRSNTGGSEA